MMISEQIVKSTQMIQMTKYVANVQKECIWMTFKTSVSSVQKLNQDALNAQDTQINVQNASETQFSLTEHAMIVKMD